MNGPGKKTGNAIVRHPGIDKIAFTGSTAVGQSIMQEAANTMKRVTLELGGKSPNIILPDADLDKAIPGVFSGILWQTKAKYVVQDQGYSIQDHVRKSSRKIS